MFEGLKKKFSNFIDSIAKKEEEEIRQEEKKDEAGHEKESAAIMEKHAPVQEAEREHGAELLVKPAPDAVKVHEQKERREEERQAEARQDPHVGQVKDTRMAFQEHGEGSRQAESRKEDTAGRQAHEYKEPVERAVPRPAARQPEQKVTLGTRLKGIVFKEVKVSHQDVEPFMEQLRISLLQSDVNYEVTEKILNRMEQELTSKPIEAKNLQRNITGVIRDSILSVLSKGSDVDMIARARSKKGSGDPFRILFIGPNGAGKTTAMAKLTKMLMDNGFTCVLSASDTFRAAAIEQTAYHASKLGVPVIKGIYGADPASVSFDAIAYAKAHRIDVVLIDSAGRQETNKSLMEEIKKMVRVAKPDMKIFVGESITGNALLNQVREFDEAVKLDGIILTKLDADAKGGNTLSILSETNVPVLFFGTGEAYDAIMSYRPEFILDSLVPNN